MDEESGSPVTGAWAAIARKEAAVEPKVDILSLLSSVGLKTVVVDANALIGGGVKLAGIADQFFTVREVLDEVRDPASRFHLATLPVIIRCLEPSEEALAAVIKFSRATGDFQSLSNVDLKLIALAYTLEAEVHGTAHIRARPPPLLVTPSSTHRQRDPPGWGIVENPEEWEDIEDEQAGEVKTQSRILGLKTLNLDSAQSSITVDPETLKLTHARETHTANDFPDGTQPFEGLGNSASTVSQEGSQAPLAHDSHLRVEGDHAGLRKPKKTEPKAAEKESLNLEGKLNVADGVDASKGEVDGDGDDWQRASCRTSRRKYLKREAKRSARRHAAESASAELPYSLEDEGANSAAAKGEGRTEDAQSSGASMGSGMDSGTKEDGHPMEDAASSNVEHEYRETADLEQEDTRLFEDGDNGSIADDFASNGEDVLSFQTDGVESEESWMVGPLWKSSIACMTGDYAMQNVLLQMGLRLLSTSGMHIRDLSKWVLKCQACNHVTSDVQRIFCPKCGNGGTLFKVSVTVGENGTVHAGRTRRINLRGTRYSLPMPKGGREGAAQNPILREDQLPNKILHPRPKKATDMDAYSSADVIFTIAHENKGQRLAGVKTAAAIFGGRRNPNERRGPRKH